ncbi:MAG: sigma-54-dependent Fis family transcriptional regulator [Alphaproteobacteria bacterium]|nr:sigma-54-dependent Fis family transcriptional regulator [Alphaproteobacteria bacterium]
MPTPLLWVEDDPALRRVYRPLLEGEGYTLTEATTAAEALAAAGPKPPKLVLLDLMLPPSQTQAEGMGVLSALLERDPGVKVIVLTGAGGRDTALEAVRQGAHDFLSKPVDPDVLLVVLERAKARARLEAEVSSLRDRLAASSPRGAMLGESPTFLAAVDLADRVAPTDLPALITGENGTGKELLARRVHEASRRAGQPFVAVNCGALPPTLLESTLFGHVRGAFTGAVQSRRGLFQEANGGTLFLDEVAELEPPTQVRLLRALESGEILPVGADRPVIVDVRLVSATNRDLDKLVAAGEFRDDLYWRLRGIEVTLPPLRDRGDDVLLLARHFLNDAALGGQHELSPRAADALRAHPWPGNLRELRHAMQRAAVMAGARARIEPADLGLRPLDTPDGGSLAAQLEALERRAIGAALAAEGGNRTRAAKRLGLSRQGLLNKMARYDLE